MANREDYKEKIRRLLALAESPNEFEARDALLKARELMAKHKLTEAELKDVEKQPVENIVTNITCSKRRDPWIIGLSAIIGEAYCCQAYRNHRRGEQTQITGFIGLKDDVEICVAIFEYAVDCARSEIKRIKRKNSEYDGSYVTRLCDSYGFGFKKGIYEAFQKQKEENEQEWGLVLVMPKEVEEATKNMGHQKFHAQSQEQLFREEYYRGLEHGTKFDPTKKLAEVGV